MVNRYVLYGASGHAKVIFEIAQELGIQIDAIIDDKPQKFNTFFKQEIIHPEAFCFENTVLLISIGNNKVRKIICKKLNLEYFKLIHHKSFVSKSSTLGKGTVVMPGALINAQSKIGKHCIINTGAIIEHDCEIEDFVHISPNASLAGNVFIGEGSHVGIGSIIIQGIKIGKWVTIGAGAVIIKDVPDYATVVGNPGKVIKINKK
jgi:sugar O-acyltransferase (sialic acid O-acetyltransferase NeuD family)